MRRTAFLNDTKPKTKNAYSKKPFDDDSHKIWLRLPYLGEQSESLVRNLIKKLRRNLKVKVNFVVIYETKKTAFFVSSKDKIPDLSRNNVIYEITCPGCNNKYIGKTERCLQTRLSEHSYNINTSAVAQHLLNCPHAQYLANLNSFYDNLNNSSPPSQSYLNNFIFNNYKIIHSCKFNSSNLLPILEALLIKLNKPGMNSGLKASKELSLFVSCDISTFLSHSTIVWFFSCRAVNRTCVNIRLC